MLFKMPWLFGLALLTIWPACRPEGEQPALSDEKIARIMGDLYVAEAATNGLTGYSKDSLTHVYYRQVFEMHGVTREAYEKDLRLIVRDVARMEAIMDRAGEMIEPEKKPAEASKSAQ